MSEAPTILIERPPPRVQHIAPDGTEVTKLTLTREQKHINVLAQLPMHELLSEELEEGSADAAPAGGPVGVTAGRSWYCAR